MKARALSTVVLWAVVLATVGFGGPFGGLVLLAALAALAQHELHHLLAQSGHAPWRSAGLALGAGLVLGAGLCPVNYVWLVAALLLTGCALRAATHPEALPRLLATTFAVAYVAGLLQYYALIMRETGPACAQGGGVGPAVWVIAVAKFCDMGGYLVGSRLGRTKLAPRISPGKTWEGVAGGLVFSAAIGALGAWLAAAWLPPWLTPGRALPLALSIAAASIISDLAESALKRRAGVKDSGRSIPGIGGALDLADSLLLPAPVAYYLFRAIGG